MQGLGCSDWQWPQQAGRTRWYINLQSGNAVLCEVDPLFSKGTVQASDGMLTASTRKDSQCCSGEYQLRYCLAQQMWSHKAPAKEGGQELNDTHADMQFEMRLNSDIHCS